MEIVWAKSAINALLTIYEYIYERSPKNAYDILQEITQKVDELSRLPYRYKPDSYKRNNSGVYRAFEHKGVRVSYKVTISRIEIVRVRHTRQKPGLY